MKDLNLGPSDLNLENLTGKGRLSKGFEDYEMSSNQELILIEPVLFFGRRYDLERWKVEKVKCCSPEKYFNHSKGEALLILHVIPEEEPENDEKSNMVIIDITDSLTGYISSNDTKREILQTFL
jgi:hypothetical protein